MNAMHAQTAGDEPSRVDQARAPGGYPPPALRCPRCHAAIGLPTDGVPTTCAGCGAIYRSMGGIAAIMPGAVDEAWHQVFAHLYETAADGSRQACYRFSRQHQIIITAYRRLLSATAGGSLLLDVGCSHGQLSASFVSRHRVVGVDFLGLCLPLAKERGLTVFQAEAAALPFVDDQFDAVICAEVFQNLTDITPVLRECVRVCRPSGLIIVSTLNRTSLLRRLLRFWRRLQGSQAIGQIEEMVQSARQRTAAEVAADASGLPVALRSVTWPHFPFKWFSTTRSPQFLGAPLASNFILTFEKVERPEP
jgi:ubiquinone/menaquinone biosynthesis C-methylase UbiE